MNEFEQKMANRLRGFNAALRGEKKSAEAFTLRTRRLELRPGAYSPKKVAQTRRMLGASQALFAQFLGVSVNTVRAWEQGVNAPSGLACRFMDEIRSSLDHSRARLAAFLKVKRPAKPKPSAT